MQMRSPRLAWRVGVALALLGGLVAGCGRHPRTDPHAVHANLGFALPDPDGHLVRLADYQGRPLVINFWATYCGPCKAEIPALNALADQYKARHLVILGVSVDDPADDIRRFLGEQPMHYPVLMGDPARWHGGGQIARAAIEGLVRAAGQGPVLGARRGPSWSRCGTQEGLDGGRGDNGPTLLWMHRGLSQGRRGQPGHDPD
jgi:thiol-disulfide isomerase/thioredoxin